MLVLKIGVLLKLDANTLLSIVMMVTPVLKTRAIQPKVVPTKMLIVETRMLVPWIIVSQTLDALRPTQIVMTAMLVLLTLVILFLVVNTLKSVVMMVIFVLMMVVMLPLDVPIPRMFVMIIMPVLMTLVIPVLEIVFTLPLFVTIITNVPMTRV